MFTESRSRVVHASSTAVFASICRIGGESGWYYADWLWQLRGILDRLMGGVGMRGRRHPEELEVGDIVDCWRVEVLEPERRLKLALELRQPGQGWLEFTVRQNGSGTEALLTATYDPGGWLGTLYWQCTKVIHEMMFEGMLRGIAARSNHSPSRAESRSGYM